MLISLYYIQLTHAQSDFAVETYIAGIKDADGSPRQNLLSERYDHPDHPQPVDPTVARGRTVTSHDQDSVRQTAWASLAHIFSTYGGRVSSSMRPHGYGVPHLYVCSLDASFLWFERVVYLNV